MRKGLLNLSKSLGTLLVMCTVCTIGRGEEGKTKEECGTCTCQSDDCPACCEAEDCPCDCQQQCSGESAAAEVVVTDADTFVSGVNIKASYCLEAELPSDQLADFALAAKSKGSCADEKCCDSCGKKEACCQSETAVTSADPLAQNMLAIRQMLQKIPGFSMEFNADSFAEFSNAKTGGQPSETQVIRTAFEKLSQASADADSSCCVNGGAVSGPQVLTQEQAAALRFAADQLEEVATRLELAAQAGEAELARELAKNSDGEKSDEQAESGVHLAQPPLETILR